MRFVQFLRPDGQQKINEIDMPPEIERMAQDLEDQDYRFEIEILADGMVFMDCCDVDVELSNQLVQNGPGMKDAVAKLVRDAHEAARGILAEAS